MHRTTTSIKQYQTIDWDTQLRDRAFSHCHPYRLCAGSGLVTAVLADLIWFGNKEGLSRKIRAATRVGNQ